jgi:hypothetical protein
MGKFVSFTMEKISKCLEPVELRRFKNHFPEYPPLFIIGPPRTGTTLLYQLMVHGFELSYFSNLANMFHMSSCIVSAWGKRALRGYRSDFKSDFGFVKGFMAPHEGAKIWNRWFPTEQREGFHYAGEGYLGEKAKSEIRRVVGGMERIFKAPFINKNVKNSVRIRALVEIFPDALFLQLKRDPIQVAFSILAARKRNCKNVNDWWSVMPKEIHIIKHKGYVEQVCGQVFYIEKDIEEDINFVGGDKRLVLSYEEICLSPKNAFGLIRCFLNARGIPLKKKRQIPNSFPLSKKDVDLDSFEKKELKKVLGQLYEEQ